MTGPKRRSKRPTRAPGSIYGAQAEEVPLKEVETAKFVHPYRCSHWTTDRCSKAATHWLLAPDGKRVPGGAVCREHGETIVTEYRLKLEQPWSLEKLPSS